MAVVSVVRCNSCKSDINRNNEISITIVSAGQFHIFFGLNNQTQVTDQEDRLDFCDKNCMVRYIDSLMEKFKIIPIPRKA